MPEIFGAAEGGMIMIYAHVPRQTPRTNADRIRAMTDEELMQFIDKKLDACIDIGAQKEDCYTVGGCARCISEWLRETAEEDRYG